MSEAENTLPKSRSWQRRKQARPSEILNAATQLMAEDGADTMRMSDIAARAGITKGTIYLYFANKAAVLSAIAERQTATLQAAE
jgi:AcrR family transcriptional regulator